MSRIVFATWDGGGNAPPMLALAVELQSRGHAVTIVGQREQRPMLADAGVPFISFETMRWWARSAATNPVALVATCGDSAWGSEVAELDADLFVVDCLLLGVMGALALAGRRYVVLEHMYDTHLMSILAKGPIALGFRLHRLNPEALYASAETRIVGTLPELDPTSGVNVRQTGPLVTGVPASPPEPTILLSLSTRKYPGLASAWQRALDAVATLPAKVIATSGPALMGGEYRVGANTEVFAWLPHSEVVPQASLVLCHGGHATTMLALAHDVPVVIMPAFRHADQPMVGATVARAGAGEAVARNTGPAELSRVIRQVMAGESYRRAAAALGARIRDGRGTQVAAQVIDDLLV